MPPVFDRWFLTVFINWIGFNLGMAKGLVLLSEKEDQEFLQDFSCFILHYFPLANLEIRDYSHQEGGGSGNLVFAKIFFPKSDYYTLLGVLRAEGNKVFILSRGLDDHLPVIQGLGLEGVICGSVRGYFEKFRHFEGFRYDKVSNGLMSAAELLKQYVR